MQFRLQKRVINSTADYISVDSDYVYGYSVYYKNLNRWNRDGFGSRTIVSNVSLSSISTNGKYIYGSNLNNKLIFRWNRDGTNQTTIDIRSSVYSIVVTSDYIYGIQGGSVHRWTNNLTNVQHNILGYDLSVRSICVDGQYIYAASSDTIYKLSPDGSELDFFATTADFASNIVSSSDYLYGVLLDRNTYGTGYVGNMYRISEEGTDFKILINNTGTVNMASLQNSPYIYWGDGDGIYELNMNGMVVPCGGSSLYYIPRRLYRRCLSPFHDYNGNNLFIPGALVQLSTFSTIMIVTGAVLFLIFCILVGYKIRKRRHQLDTKK